jgi:hypothetical protein
LSAPLVIAGLDPAIHRCSKTLRFWMDARVIYAKTRFALLPGHDKKQELHA